MLCMRCYEVAMQEENRKTRETLDAMELMLKLKAKAGFGLTSGCHDEASAGAWLLVKELGSSNQPIKRWSHDPLPT